MSEVVIKRAPRQPYELEDVKIMLGYLFHGGQAWAREDAPDADMPKAKGNPARQNTHVAAMIDMRRAVSYLAGQDLLRNEAALWWYYAEGFTQKAIARRQGITQQSVQEALDADTMAVRDAMNKGLRPRERGGLWPRAMAA